MTAFISMRSVAFAFAIAATALAGASGANAAGAAKDFFVETYKFSKPMNGYSGFSSSYYCDYQKQPDTKCSIDKYGNQKCVIVGWTLQQMCQ